MRIIKRQVITSTLLDTQGEKQSLEYLQDLLESFPQSLPLGVEHDFERKSIGRICNFEIDVVEGHPTEHALYGDIHCPQEIDFDASCLQGLSYSTVQRMCDNGKGQPLSAVYLPYPFYTKDEEINYWLKCDEPVAVGKWIKKSADPLTITLIALFSQIVLKPIWDDTYKAIKSELGKRFRQAKENKKFEYDVGLQLKTDFGLDFNAYLITEKGNEESLNEDKVMLSLYKIHKEISQDTKAREIGVDLFKMIYRDDEYHLHSIRYKDGHEKSY